MKVLSTMSREVISVGPDDPLPEVYELMVEEEIRHIPVMEYDKVIGILSRGDVLLQAVPDDRKAYIPDVKVKDAMTPDPITCTETSQISQVARVMVNEKIDCLPVVRGDTLIGMITSSDILAIVAGQTFFEVSRLVSDRFRLTNWRKYRARMASAPL